MRDLNYPMGKTKEFIHFLIKVHLEIDSDKVPLIKSSLCTESLKVTVDILNSYALQLKKLDSFVQQRVFLGKPADFHNGQKHIATVGAQSFKKRPILH